MNRATPENVGEKLSQALALTMEALDMSTPLFKTDQEENVVMLWETFIKEFVGYARQKTSETGVNLINYMSMGKILFR